MQAVNAEMMHKKANLAGDLLKVLANPSRLQILCFLIDGEKPVQEIERQIGMRQSALSQHLAVLRRERLVKTRRQAQFIYYSLASDKAKRLIEVLYEIYCTPKSKTAQA